MLYSYQYIGPHHIEKFQTYLDFLFFEVWLPATGRFNTSKLDINPEFKDIYTRLEIQDSDTGNIFTNKIAQIYEAFAIIDDSEFKEAIKQFYIANNNIEQLCNDKTIIPITYKELEEKQPDLNALLKSFYSKLYGSTSPFNLKIFGELSKELMGKYDFNFMELNTKGICPFCGILPLKDNNASYREAYDHYLPKGLYPFNSINFKNLAPMCHECNSTYKLSKVPIDEKDGKNINPIQKTSSRKLAFYPYATDNPEIEDYTFEIKINTNDILNIKPEDIELTINVEDNDEKVETWKRVFGIDERYKALLCKELEGKAWFTKVYDEYENAQCLSEIENAEKYYDYILRDAKKILLSSNGFLKSVFLEECKAKGLFDNI
ncbi:MAG: hypothetical protein ACPGVH_01805 [Chitinophagales bacterium]